MNSNSIQAKECPDERSRRLWPDPFDAPDVPEAPVLAAFSDSPSSLSVDMHEQIAGSANCRRAAALVALWGEPSDDFARVGACTGKELEDAGKILAMLKPMPELLPTPAREAISAAGLPGTVRPQAGMICTTATRVEHFAPERDCAWRQLNRSPLVLITEAGLVSDAWEPEVAVVPLSPLDLWPEPLHEADERIVERPGWGKMVAHLWLRCRVHADQLEACVARAAGEDFEQVRQGLSRSALFQAFSNEFPPLLLLERERLAEEASWLGATLHARNAQASALETKLRRVKTDLATRLALPAMAGGPSAIPGWQIKGPLHQALVAGVTAVAESKFVATQTLPPRNRPDGEVVGMWSLTNLVLTGASVVRFVLVDLGAGTITGRGVIQAGANGLFASLTVGDVERILHPSGMLIMMVQEP